MRAKPVLVGDVGGATVRFACAHRRGDGGVEVEHVMVMPGEDFTRFGDALAAYIAMLPGAPPSQAFLAMAGPVSGGRVTLTHRDWQIDGEALAAKTGLAGIQLVNDYAAMARAVPELPDTCFQTLHAGTLASARQPVLVAGPGTGLGMATLLPDGAAGWRVLTGEGGHAAFAASTDREWALRAKLLETHDYVSKELVLSGAGLNAVYRALCALDGVEYVETPPAEMMARARSGDPVFREICKLRAAATLDALGDAALTNGTRGGVVITGGVSACLAEWLAAPEALQRFSDRGAMSGYMRAIPIRLLLSGEAGLIGAAALYFDGVDVALAGEKSARKSVQSA